MRSCRFLMLLVALSCASPISANESTPSDELARLDRITRTIQTADHEQISLLELVDALSAYDAIFVGETHLDDTTHDVEAALYRSLVDVAGRQVILALEMFERDTQAALDAYLASEIDEVTFLHRARAWHNYRTGYREMIEFAKERGLPVVASNAPARIRAKISMGGQEAFDGLSKEERAYFPPKLYANSESYWERFYRTTRFHGRMMMSNAGEGNLYSGQSLWDNTMGFSCAEALQKYPGALVYHVNGGFHSAYKEGTVAQFARRAPGAKAVTVSILPARDILDVEEGEGRAVADYVVLSDGRARGPQNGQYAVRMDRELEYRIHKPRGAALGKKLPVLIWLGPDGLRSQENLALWKVALGNECMIVCVDPPHRQIEEDLRLGGRWYWTDTFEGFSRDLGSMQFGLERIVDYLLTHFDVDADRMVLAGRGDGATVAIATALYSRDLELEILAFEPTRYQNLSLQSLPELPPTAEKLTVLAESSQLGFWDEEMEAYRSAGLNMEVEAVGPLSFSSLQGTVRSSLGLDGLAVDPEKKVALVDPVQSVQSSHWAAIYGTALAKNRKSVRVISPQEADSQSGEVLWLGVEGEVPASRTPVIPWSRLRGGEGIPLPTGTFGGTTVLYVPFANSDELRQRWVELEENDVLRRRSRFAGIRIAFPEGERELGAVLSGLADEGKSNVLVVPAVFCADATTMRDIRERVGSWASQFDLSYLPGLGGECR